MPLLDHFRPPLHPQRHWESFHANWAGAMADVLNEVDDLHDLIQLSLTLDFDDQKVKARERFDDDTGFGRLGDIVGSRPQARAACDD